MVGIGIALHDLTFHLAAVIAGELNTKPTPVQVAADLKVTKNLNTYLRPDTRSKYTANRHNFTFLIPHPNPPPLGEGVYEKRRLCQFAV